MKNEIWHMLTHDQVLEKFKVDKRGLTDNEAKKRLEKYGLNKLEEKKPIDKIKLFLNQFKSVLILLLIIASIISFLIGEYIDGIVISIILLINATLGFIQEYRAEKSMEALKKMVVSTAKIIREGKKITIDVSEIVPGDIVLFEEGDRIPADIRLIDTINLKVDESSLTGESSPVLKIIGKIKDKPITERKNMVYMGTTVSSGKGMGVVVSTGMDTQIGNIAEIIQEKKPQTPLQKKLDSFGKLLGLLGIAVCVIIMAFGFISKIAYSESVSYVELFMIGVTLAVSMVPEGLPAIATINMAIGIKKMSKENALVRHLSSVETLGSVTVICADKTGTMTTNQMMVRSIWTYKNKIGVTGSGFDPTGSFFKDDKELDHISNRDIKSVIEAGYLCNNSQLIGPTFGLGSDWKITGDPTEGALLVLAKKSRLEVEDKRLFEVPFSSERKMMTTVNEVDREEIVYSKGAPEVILDICNRILVGDKEVRISQKHREKVLKSIQGLTSNGMRVIGFARSSMWGRKLNKRKLERNLVFLGMVGIIDPPRNEVRTAIRKCKRAGIKTIMITGDHKLTAVAIAKELDIISDDEDDVQVLTGEEMQKMSDDDLDKVIDSVSVYARVLPEHKVKVLESLKRKGHIVAMTGDGVNDAPALKRSDIGVAMGIKGTDVAKEVSDIVLLDDNFASITKAVEEGRGIYDNIRKSIRFLLSANFDEVIETSLAIFMGLPLPFLPLQILWINLITDGLPALALAVDPKDKDIMKRKPRDPKKRILSGMTLFIIVASLFAVTISLGLFIWELRTTGNVEKARTMAVTSAIFFELFFVMNCRSEDKSVFRNNLMENKKLLFAVLISAFLHASILYVPFLQKVFGMVSLGLIDWTKILISSSVGLFVFPEIFMRKRK